MLRSNQSAYKIFQGLVDTQIAVHALLFKVQAAISCWGRSQTPEPTQVREYIFKV